MWRRAIPAAIFLGINYLCKSLSYVRLRQSACIHHNINLVRLNRFDISIRTQRPLPYLVASLGVTAIS